MNRELKKVKKWLDANRLSLNIDKTNFVIFHPPRVKIPEPVIVKFGRKKIQCENSVKFLGILFDSNLSWKHHINELSKKLSRTLGLFYKIRHYVPLELLKQLYYSLFYSCLIWNYCLGSYLEVTCSEINCDSKENNQGHDIQ